MLNSLILSGASRCCVDFHDSTAFSRMNEYKRVDHGLVNLLVDIEAVQDIYLYLLKEGSLNSE